MAELNDINSRVPTPSQTPDLYSNDNKTRSIDDQNSEAESEISRHTGSDANSSENDEEDEEGVLEPLEKYDKLAKKIDKDETSAGVSCAYLALEKATGMECVWQEVHLDEHDVTLSTGKYRKILRHFETLCGLEHLNLVEVKDYWFDYQYLDCHELQKNEWHDVDAALTQYCLHDYTKNPSQIEDLTEILEKEIEYEYINSEDSLEASKTADREAATATAATSTSHKKRERTNKILKQNTDRRKIKYRLVFITEYMSSGTLDTHYREMDENQNSPSQDTVIRWLYQILSALDYLHSFSTPLIHNNLSAKTVFRHHNGTFKVGGFWYDVITRHLLGNSIRSPQVYFDNKEAKTSSRKAKNDKYKSLPYANSNNNTIDSNNNHLLSKSLLAESNTSSGINSADINNILNEDKPTFSDADLNLKSVDTDVVEMADRPLDNLVTSPVEDSSQTQVLNS